jgi:virulence factor Mce-like protein
MGTPILIGSVTVLVLVVAVFLSYNANSGLPFVPTYQINVQVQDAAGLVKGNDVRVGGKRVGSVAKIDGKVGPDRPYARLELKLDKPLEPLLDDSRVTVRPRSPLGLKYLEIVPGRSGRPVKDGGELALERSVQTVELDEVLDTFDESTRRALQRTVSGLGVGVAGRGVDFNESVALAPRLAGNAENVFGNLSDPRTRLRRAVRALGRVTDELGPVAPRAGRLFDNANTTLHALSGVRPELAAVLAGLPPTEAIATDTLRATRPVLAETRQLLRDLRPGVRALPSASRRLHAALDRGIPVLRRTGDLADRLTDALVAVEDLSADPLTRDSLKRLDSVLRNGLPTLQYVVPAQSVCNHLGIWLRNASSTVAEGDLGGTWVRTLIIINHDEMLQTDKPAPRLHFNPYPATAGPGTGGECEAGNEPFVPGQQIGNLPGVQATTTENTNRFQGLLRTTR